MKYAALDNPDEILKYLSEDTVGIGMSLSFFVVFNQTS